MNNEKFAVMTTNCVGIISENFVKKMLNYTENNDFLFCGVFFIGAHCNSVYR